MAKCRKLNELKMGNFPHLSNAPIVEAIIDLRIETEKKWESESFREDLSNELPDYPIIEPQRIIRVETMAKKDEIPRAAATDLGLIGFFFRSEDKLHVAQFQRDGFSFSRLKPYLDWEHLVSEAKRLWNIYQKHTSIQSITRLGVRFINTIDDPLGKEISTYLVNAPEPPCNSKWTFNEFLHRDVFEVPNTPYTVILTSSMRPDSIKVQYVVDIDVFTKSDLEIEVIWGEHLNQMRNLKNKMFFGSIQPTILEEMK
jgi:uncharacterized protein (TIGR04255 family)